jgi:hypothetical protein
MRIPDELEAQLDALASRVARPSRPLPEMCSLEGSPDAQTIFALWAGYKHVPISLADGCPVRLSESNSGLLVFTLDHDCQIYHCHGQQKIPLLIPAKGN